MSLFFEWGSHFPSQSRRITVRFFRELKLSKPSFLSTPLCSLPLGSHQFVGVSHRHARHVYGFSSNKGRRFFSLSLHGLGLGVAVSQLKRH